MLGYLAWLDSPAAEADGRGVARSRRLVAVAGRATAVLVAGGGGGELPAAAGDSPRAARARCRRRRLLVGTLQWAAACLVDLELDVERAVVRV